MSQVKTQDSSEIVKNFERAEDYASDYLRTFFMGEPTEDDKALMRFLVEHYPAIHNKPLMLEVGCGPVVDHVMPAVPHVSEIHMADYRQDNLDEISKWIKKQPDAHNWERFSRFILETEGVKEPTSKQKQEREETLRSLIKKLSLCDLRSEFPFGKFIQYPVVSCFYTTEQASSDIKEWKDVMKNLCSLVEPKGHLFMCAVGNTDHYILYDKNGNSKKYPVPYLTEEDFKAILPTLGFDPKKMLVKYQTLEGQETEGVFGVILVSAKKA